MIDDESITNIFNITDEIGVLTTGLLRTQFFFNSYL